MTWRYAAAVVAIVAVGFLWARTPAHDRLPAAPVVPAATAAPASPPLVRVTPHFTQQVTYTGHWQLVAHGGRLPGHVSARSFRPGDALTLLYWGKRVRMYAIAGPKGGAGDVVQPGYHPAAVSFMAPSRSVHRLIYVGPLLATGIHTLSVVVVRSRRRGYVNIDAFEVDGRSV